MVGGVGAEDNAVLAHVCAFDAATGQYKDARKSSSGVRLLVWQPLRGESRPFERAAVEDVVEEDAVFLPDLVFFVDNLVLDLFLVFHFAGVDGVYSGGQQLFTIEKTRRCCDAPKACLC